MRPLLLLLVLTLALIGQVASAAQEKLPSAPRERQNAEDEALNQAAQIQQCMTTLRVDPSATLTMAEQYLAIARAANDTGTESRLLRCKGDAHEALGDSEAASQAYLAAVAIAQNADDKAFLSFENLGSFVRFQEARILRFSAQENYQKAFEAGIDLRNLQRHLDKRQLERELATLKRELADRKNNVVESEKLHRVESLHHVEKQRKLWWQVIVLGSSLLALLSILGLRQFYRTRRIRILSMTDDLTRLPNRQHILTFLGDQAKVAYEEGQPLSVIAFDIDNFKQINEKYGHEAGDRIIKAVADIANQALRRGDRVGRLGGKEFLVVLPGSPKRPAVDVAERLRQSVEVTDMEILVQALRVSISLGVCEWNAGHESIDALLKRTHGALDQAKEEGRNRVGDK